MTAFNLYLPDGLKERMRKLDREWSKLLRQRILEELDQRKEDHDG